MADDNLPIIDAHHHVWDLSLGKHPWLAPGALIPYRYGDYSAIKRNFMPADYAHVTRGHDVVASVTMEAEWDETDLAGETRWMAKTIAETGMPAAHVARAILDSDDAEAELAAHAAFAFVRGIRHKPTAARSAREIEHGAAGGMSDPRWRRGYALLARHGLHFELQAPWWHVDELTDLVSSFPETPVVINHAFLPADRTAEGLSGWKAAIRRAASIPTASIKISGIGVAGRAWSLEDNRPIILDTIDAFGPQRCLFASNFPVDGLTGSFDAIYAGFKAATRGLSRSERVAMLHDNAVRVYRLDRYLLAEV